MEKRLRPPILKNSNEFSEFVEGFITDRNGELVGLLLTRGKWSFIQFFEEKKEKKKMILTPLIVWDKEKREVDIDAEVFYRSPKELLNRIYRNQKNKEVECHQ